MLKIIFSKFPNAIAAAFSERQGSDRRRSGLHGKGHESILYILDAFEEICWFSIVSVLFQYCFSIVSKCPENSSKMANAFSIHVQLTRKAFDNPAANSESV